MDYRQKHEGTLIEGDYFLEGDNVIGLREPSAYKERFRHFIDFYNSVKEEHYPLDPEKQGVLYHIPQANLLILGLNSCWEVDHHFKSRASISPDALSNALDTIRKEEAYQNCLKFAVWHHPLNSPDEDRIKDHGFMERLANSGFLVCLHGHIHKAGSGLYLYDHTANGRQIRIISAGTFGAPVREWHPGYPLQYNLLNMDGNKLIVETRCRREINGAWKPDAIWTQGAGKDPLPRYTIDLLKDQKAASQITQPSFLASRETSQLNVLSPPLFPTALVDTKISEDVDILRRSRFFAEFAGSRFSSALARKLVQGELSGGTDAVRSRALAWCVRVLSRTDEFEKAEKYLEVAKDLGSCPEIEIADAFMSSQKGDREAALRTLAIIDSRSSRSAALMVVGHHDGHRGAIDWLKSTGIHFEDFESEGKFIYLSYQLELFYWGAALENVESLSDDDFREVPPLHHIAAIANLLSTVPMESRVFVLSHVPFDAATFPLASDAVAIKSRRVAYNHFLEASNVASQLNCPNAAILDDDYALWLELTNSEQASVGRKRLEGKLGDPKSALHYVPLGCQFGIKMDFEAVEREIERQVALYGKITADAAIARFALAFTRKRPEDVANYIAQYHEQLSEHIHRKSMSSIQIEMFCRAGMVERAKECLDILVNKGLSDTEKARLQLEISKAEGTDPAEALKEQFGKTGTLADLIALVNELEVKNEWNGLCDYGKTLFERTRSLHDAERLATALRNTQDDEHLLNFLQANPVLVNQSKTLQMLYCWALYCEGELLGACSELAKLSDNRDDQNYRALQVSIGIALGDWTSLSRIVANDCLEKDRRRSRELPASAQLALDLGSPNSRELIFAAARKADDDPAILAAAYFLATKAGWEDDAEVFQWVQKAAALSGDDGPIQKMTLKDVMERKPDWDRKESEVWQHLSRGGIPLFIAAQSLNRSLAHLMLFPALASLTQNDPRRRGAVLAYSGKRQPMSLDTNGRVGLDATALLTLSFLDLLDKSLEVLDNVYVPHSTLSWLLEEKQKVTFHQPSRIRSAHQIRHLLAVDALKELSPSTVPDSDLSAQVGEELALLIAEAEKNGREDQIRQHLVVQSFPVHRVGSLMEEEADLTSRAGILSSCQAVVEKLRQLGQVTAEEGKKALAYLQLCEKPWPNQPEISDRAVLYLDSLSVTYFHHTGILDKLKLGGFVPIVSPRVVIDLNELISYDSVAGNVQVAIERIRSAINSRIGSGKIKVGRRIKVDNSLDNSLANHPSFAIFSMVNYCDSIITDDRYINQHANIDEVGARAAIFSTLDLLDALVSKGAITAEDRTEYRARLRRAGYLFVPVNNDELASHLVASVVKDNKVVEVAELKAIRESILRVRMSTYLQMPDEAFWLDTTLKTYIRVLKSLWRVDSDFSNVQVRSNWLTDQIDPRGWAHCLGHEVGDNLVKFGRTAHILLLLSPPINAPEMIRNKYWAWVERRVLIPIKEEYPDLFAWITDWYRREIKEMAENKLPEGAEDVQ